MPRRVRWRANAVSRGRDAPFVASRIPVVYRAHDAAHNSAETDEKRSAITRE